MKKEVPQPTTATRSPDAGSRERSSGTRAATRTQSPGWVATSAARKLPPSTSEGDACRVMGRLPGGSGARVEGVARTIVHARSTPHYSWTRNASRVDHGEEGEA